MPCFLEVLYTFFYSSVVVMLILPVFIILRYTLRYYTILILAGARHVPVIVIGELFRKEPARYNTFISGIILTIAR